MLRDRLKDMTELTVAFGNFANAPKTSERIFPYKGQPLYINYQLDALIIYS